MKTVTKCEYEKRNGRWIYRCQYDNSGDFVVHEINPENPGMLGAFYAVVEHIVSRGCALACQPAGLHHIGTI